MLTTGIGTAAMALAADKAAQCLRRLATASETLKDALPADSERKRRNCQIMEGQVLLGSTADDLPFRMTAMSQTSPLRQCLRLR